MIISLTHVDELWTQPTWIVICKRPQKELIKLTYGSDASPLSFNPNWLYAAALKCIKNVKMALGDSRVVKSMVFGVTCVPPLTLDQILLGLYLLCPPPTLSPPPFFFHHSVKWSGIPTVLLLLKTMRRECRNTPFSVSNPSLATFQLQICMHDIEFNAVWQWHSDFKVVTRLCSNSMV